MQLETLADVKLIGRALLSGWLDGCEARKRQAVHDLFDVVENHHDGEMRIKAFTALVKAGDADRKREELSIKKQTADELRRLRLLELLKHVPAGTLAAIASGNAAIVGDGREAQRRGAEGGSESGTA